MIALVTGAAGFIGSHLVNRLLADGWTVRGHDLSISPLSNMPEACQLWLGDIRDSLDDVMDGVDVVFHEAAMRSVPQSVEHPEAVTSVNVVGFLSVLRAATEAGVRRVIYASSSSVYGSATEIQTEDQPLAPRSPYAASKLAGEVYAQMWTRLHGLETIGLRYFNVFGPRQDPAGSYAAVIPKFIASALRDEPLTVYGDGTQARDFTYIDNVVQANMRALIVGTHAIGEVYNVGCGRAISLLDLIHELERIFERPLAREHSPARAGDVLRTCADLTRARRVLGYAPEIDFYKGLLRTV